MAKNMSVTTRILRKAEEKKDISKKENEKMWERFKESRFAQKCRALSRRKGFMVTLVCLILAMSVVLSVSIATNRAKKKYGGEDTVNTGELVTEQPNEQGTQNNQNGGQVNTPIYNDTDADQVGANGEEEFKLSLPVSGSLAKGHDSSIQVWSDTMGDYRVHLGVDIATEENAPVYAAADGVVSKVWDDALMGRCVAIEHDNATFTVYKNLAETLASGIKSGAEVKCGQQIGNVGETAISELADEPHVHLEMTVNGLAVNPMDYFGEEDRKTLNTDNSYESNATEDVTVSGK